MSEQELRKSIQEARLLTKIPGNVKQFIGTDMLVQLQDTSIDLLVDLMTRYGNQCRIDELRKASDMQHMMRRADRTKYCFNRALELYKAQEMGDSTINR